MEIRLPSIVSNPGVYRKLLVYIGMAVLVVLNEFFGFGIDEETYTENLKELANIILMVIGGFAVWRVPNDKPPGDGQ